MDRRHLAAFAFAAMLAGCTRGVHMQADHGGFLTDQEIQPLDVIARQTAATEAATMTGRSGAVLPEYVFAFQPGFDIREVTALSIRPFTAQAKDGEDIARDIPPSLVARAADNKVIPPAVLASGPIAPDAYVLSGAVTRVVNYDFSAATLQAQHETSVALRVSRNNDVVGVIQINVVGRQPSPLLLAPTLIFSALQGSRATLVSRRLEDVFSQLRSGHLSGASASPSDYAFMPVQPAVPP